MILVGEKAKKNQEESPKEPIKIYEEAFKKHPENNTHFTYKLAGLYDGVYNDQESYLQLRKKDYELDSTTTNHILELN